MVKGHITPSAGVMTGAAIRPKLPVVLILTGVAGITVRGRALVYTVGMAGGTLNAGMLSSQRETGFAVIKTDIGPFRGLMTGTAIRTELSVVLVLAGMACETIRRRTLEYIIGMAGFA